MRLSSGRGGLALSVLLGIALSECAPLIGLDEDYYVATGGGAGDQGGTTQAAGSGGASGGGSGGVAGGAGEGGSMIGGGGLAAEGGAGGSGGLPVIPPGKLVFQRYTEYGAPDTEMFVVSFPELDVLDIKETYDLCNPVNGIFSPDGAWLAVTAEPPADTCPETVATMQDVYLLDLIHDPPTRIQVTGNSLPDEDPQFSPDGTFIVFKHNKHLAKWDIGSPPFTDCANLMAGSFCFTPSSGASEQSKPVLTVPDADRLCYYELFSGDADIHCIPLADALLGADLLVESTPVVAHPGISDARPNFTENYLYYVHWHSDVVPKDRIARRPVDDLQNSVDDHPTFISEVTNPALDYSDPCSLDEELVIFSSNVSGMGEHDIFIGSWNSGEEEVYSLNLWTPDINTAKFELAAVFWRAP